MNAAVFLDRDNTLIQNDGDLGDPEQVKLVQGAASAIASLRGLGYKIVVVSNQGGVARGKFTEADVERVNQRINELVKTNSGATIDRFYFCPFHPEATIDRYRRDHPWRKPQPGMLLQAAKDLDIDPTLSWMVGDQMRDVEAGAAAGARTILLRDDAEDLNPLRVAELVSQASVAGAVPVGPLFAAKNLIEAVRIIAQQRKPETPEEARARQRADRIREISQAGRNISPPRTPDHVQPATIPTPAPKPPAPEASPVSRPPAAAVTPLHEPTSDGEILRQILQELRHQRAARGDFSFYKMLAVIFQLIVVVCVAGAFWMGHENQDEFVRCIATAGVVQLMTIATLLFGR